MNIRLHKLKVSSAVLLALIAHDPVAAEGAAAGDLVFPGIGCKLYGPQNTDTFLDPAGFGATGLKNTATTSKKLICPVTRPFENAIEWAIAYIGTASTNSTAPKCYLYRATFHQPNFFDSVPFEIMGGSFVPGVLANWNLDGEVLGGGSTASLYCSVFPAEAVIYDYGIGWMPPD